jgi:hypothetical protein
MEDHVLVRPKAVAIAVALAGALSVAGLVSWAEEDEESPAALAQALPAATVLLDQGLRASAREGRPISGKYEIEDQAFQLSVYTMKGNEQFEEVIVDHKSGIIKKAEKITDADDLKDAKEQGQAMAKAKVPLDQAVGNAVKANSGYRAVRVTPTLYAGKPVAEVTLMKGAEMKTVRESLD